MTTTDILIVGAGPAGAACAGALQRRGIPFILLDKAVFPRDKTCAGWLTPAVFRSLGITPRQYPYGLKVFRKFVIHLHRRRVILPVEQYTIRRVEFDRFLLEHFHLEPVQHQVRAIRQEEGYFVVDDRYRARRLVGAGGSYCPVAARFFPERKEEKRRWVSALEAEYPCRVEDDRCHLWFGLKDLPGYAWYVPKAEGYLNIGIGGYTQRMKGAGTHIREQWEAFLLLLKKEGLLTCPPPTVRGYNYPVRGQKPQMQKDRIIIIGDAAGLATSDMGEGIGPAIESGLLAARSLATGETLTARPLRRHSFNHLKTLLQVGWRYLFSVF